MPATIRIQSGEEHDESRNIYRFDPATLPRRSSGSSHGRSCGITREAERNHQLHKREPPSFRCSLSWVARMERSAMRGDKIPIGPGFRCAPSGLRNCATGQPFPREPKSQCTFTSASLIELNAEPAHDPTPAFDLVRIELDEFVARRRARLESERLDPTRKDRGPHDLHQLAIEPVENRLRRSSPGVKAGPERTDQLGPSQLHRRRHVWQATASAGRS